MVRAREAFEASTDFTVGIEEEFQILDPDTLALAQRFEELHDAALAAQRDLRASLFRLAADRGLTLAATGTHPWSPWQEQRIIDTPHYSRLRRELG